MSIKDEGKFLEGIQSKDRRTQLETMRDLVAHELTAHRCNSCESIRMRTSDTAALVLRLQKILEELANIPEKSEQKSEYEKIQERVANKVASGEHSNVVYPFGTKNAPRRQGGRRKPVKGDD